jgi:hypothetical protein
MPATTATRKSLGNVRVGAQPIDTTQLNGEETKLCYMQFTSTGMAAYEANTVPNKGMTFWSQLDETHISLMELDAMDVPEGYVPCIFGKLYDNAGDGAFTSAIPYL